MNNKANEQIFRILKGTAELLETALIAIFAITMIFTYLLKIVTVEGESMQNTLMPDDRVITSSICLSPSNGDVVIINADEAVIFNNNNEIITKPGINKQIVKRIIASSGQTVDINFESGMVYVDGVLLDETYITGLTHLDEGAFSGQYPITIPEGYVFVLGDNRTVSKDSRSSEIGLVAIDNIIGKVILRIYPLSEFGFVD